MKLSTHRVDLPLEYQFTIARGSITSQPSLVVVLEHGGECGYGEVTENSYYGHTLDSMQASIERLRPKVESYEFGEPQDLWARLRSGGDDLFALSAIDIAAHDLYGKLIGQPTYKTLGLTWNDVPQSSYTIGIDTVEKMIAKLRARPDWGIYKIKLGTDRDIEIIRELRTATGATFRVDANCGWTAEQTVRNAEQMQPLGVEFIEQPLPADCDPDDQRFVFERSVLPVVADESCQVEEDVDTCRGLFHGVNVKVCKCGGLTPAARMLKHARDVGLKTMVGCMVESSIGISGAAHLLPLLDYADLDGAELIANDIADGVRVESGVVRLSETNGNGVSRVDLEIQSESLIAR